MIDYKKLLDDQDNITTEKFERIVLDSCASLFLAVVGFMLFFLGFILSHGWWCLGGGILLLGTVIEFCYRYKEHLRRN